MKTYTSPEASDTEIIETIRSTARFGIKYVTEKCNALKKTARDAKVFGHAVSSNYTRILLYIDFIELYDKQISAILSNLHTLVEENERTKFLKQIHLIES